MTDIVIYTNEKTLLHKQDKLPDDSDKSEEGDYCWEFSRPPKDIKEGDRVYFAVKGKVVGSFRIFLVWDGREIVEWMAKTWRPLRPSISCKPFQGFRYKWW